jgi:hypothetical protein
VEEKEVKEIDVADEISEIENIGELIDFGKDVDENIFRHHNMGKWLYSTRFLKCSLF